MLFAQRCLSFPTLWHPLGADRRSCYKTAAAFGWCLPSSKSQMAVDSVNPLLAQLLRARLAATAEEDNPTDDLQHVLPLLGALSTLASALFTHSRRPRSSRLSTLASLVAWAVSYWLTCARSRRSVTLRGTLKTEAAALIGHIEALPPSSSASGSSRELGTQTDAPPMLAPPLLAPPMLGGGAAPPPPPPPPPPPLPFGAPTPQRRPTAHELMGGMALLRKAASGEEMGGPTPIKKNASDLAGARSLGISLEQLQGVSLKRLGTPRASTEEALKRPTPEILKARAKLRTVEEKAASPLGESTEIASPPPPIAVALRPRRRSSGRRRAPLSPLANGNGSANAGTRQVLKRRFRTSPKDQVGPAAEGGESEKVAPQKAVPPPTPEANRGSRAWDIFADFGGDFM